MSKEQTGNTTANEKPPETTAADVAKVSGQLVAILQPLPPAMQIRALGATATMLGIDKEQRSRQQTQQRSGNSNGSNQRTNR